MSPLGRLATAFAALACAGSQAGSAQPFLPLSEVQAGQTGVGRTVFQGERIEEFPVEILGVLENVGPKQSLILARLSGERIERTGVMAGMSGSPVYVDGKLIGAIAFSFPFSTEPLAGIRPIEDMVAGSRPTTQAKIGAPSLPSLAELLDGSRPIGPAPAAAGRGDRRSLIPIATPVSFGGFTTRTLDVFGDQLRALGLEPLQGVGGQSRKVSTTPLRAGSMVSVGLIRGDLNVTAAGTVTLVEQDRIYAFGHPFLSTGPSELPLMRSRVITTVPSLMNSFKLAGTGELVGRIRLDRTTGIVGDVGSAPPLTRLRVDVSDGPGRERQYDLELVRDPFLTPFLTQMGAFSAIDATERRIGPHTLRVSGTARFDGLPDLDLGGLYAGPTAVSAQAALGVAARLAFVMQSAPSAPTPREMTLHITAESAEQRARLVRVWADRERLRPGEEVELSAALRMADGSQRLERLRWRVPAAAEPGVIHATFSDATQLNFLDFPILLDAGKLSASQMIGVLNKLRTDDRLYLRIWRQRPAIRVRTARLGMPPASLRSVLAGPLAIAGGAVAEPYSTLAERVVGDYGQVIEGQESLQLSIIP